MKLNNIWGYGQLFGFSALDGANRFKNDFIATLTHEHLGLRFELSEWIKVKFPMTGEISFKAIMSDFIEALGAEGELFVTFAENDVLVGYSPVLPVFEGQKELARLQSGEAEVWYNEKDAMALLAKKTEKGYRFAIGHAENTERAAHIAEKCFGADIETLKKARYAYYEGMPACKNPKYEQLYYKALSINKVNVRTAEGNIPCIWTTPDRVPHRRLWLWDSVFHALAIVNYNQELAKNAIRAVLAQIQPNGFIPHMIDPDMRSHLTQPQVLAWGVWEVYRKTGDKAFMQESVDALDRFLVWSMEYRDKNGNGLLEWFTEPDYTNCRCGESGLDNSPRFDFDDDMDAVDFSAFLAHDAEYLAKIYRALGNEAKAQRWLGVYEKVRAKMNELLWDEETGAYYDRLFGGSLSKILTPASFFPLFAGIPTAEQAEKMVETLTDERLLWSKVPLASVAQNHPTYSTDMWRGGVWLNFNYFTVKGLKRYGYHELAQTLIEKTLNMVNTWYEKTGTIFEFYDPEGKTVPYLCERKGAPIDPPDWRKHIHSIVDYNWSACFTQMYIQNELYCD